jgi:hypothetical protein
VVDWNGEALSRTAKPRLIPEMRLVMAEYQIETTKEVFSELQTMRYLFEADIV